jgi:phosphoglucomutase
MAEKVAKNYGVTMIDVLTGFKFIGEQIGFLEAKGEEDRYIFGFEESYGYLSGAYVRDKDAVNASMLICEMTAYYKKAGKTLVDRLCELYEKYGYYKNDLMEFTFEGAAGMERMNAIMKGLRENPPAALIGRRVVEDCRLPAVAEKNTGELQSLRSGCGNKADQAAEIRCAGICPGGRKQHRGPSLRTEPKLKIYLSAKGGSRPESEEIIAG